MNPGCKNAKTGSSIKLISHHLCVMESAVFTCFITFPISCFSLYWLSWTQSYTNVTVQSVTCLFSNTLIYTHHLRTPHINICDGHAFGLYGWLTGHAAPSLLQRHLPVWDSISVRAGGPRSTRSVAVRRGHSVGGHIHGCHQVSQLTRGLHVQLSVDSVGAHGGLVVAHSQLSIRNIQLHHCTEGCERRNEKSWRGQVWWLVKKNKLLKHCFKHGH